MSICTPYLYNLPYLVIYLNTLLDTVIFFIWPWYIPIKHGSYHGYYQICRRYLCKMEIKSLFCSLYNHYLSQSIIVLGKFLICHFFFSILSQFTQYIVYPSNLGAMVICLINYFSWLYLPICLSLILLNVFLLFKLDLF